MTLNQEELQRYSRQMIIPDFGAGGQQKLKDATVFVAGIGGLGSVSSYYLAAAGIGKLRIVDRDKVDFSNLNRQIIHWTSDIGEWKSDSARKKLMSLNPNCSIEAIQEEITGENCERLTENCSVIVDAMDNMAGRKVLNIASVKKRIPYIYGGVFQLDGMATTFLPGETPCLECVFPDPGAATISAPPSILGPVPGVIASIQCIEAINLILGFPGLLAGRLLCFCGSDMTFREFKINRDPACPICNESQEPGARSL
jgi:molybdopterin-synthase adenylyltransferase